MLNNNLPTHVDPVRFAENAMDLHGTLPISNMLRLAPSLNSPTGEAQVHIQFGMDKKIKFSKGQVKAELAVQCQRCLEPFVYEIISDFAFGIVETDAKAKELPAHYDPVLIIDDSLNLAEMIEEELIINLPIVLMHDPKDCKVKMPVVVLEDPDATQPKKVNPFKVIESLKVKPK
ncbi:MAG: YceD family protein [Pseudomonadota bacterium]